MSSNERALTIKQLQEEALTNLPLNTLHIALWIRSDPPKPNDFHWAFYLHMAPNYGAKYHIKTLGGGWICDHGRTSDMFKSNFLCVLIQISAIPQVKHAELEQIMKSRDHDVNSIPGVTCRVWVLTILEKLIQHGLVRCSSIESLERECFDIGNVCSPGASKNEQPRPVVKSEVCH